ncbi:hypothetical protein [Methylobacterium phyllosphaerae]|uniref:hypothetical protein n=1 Tax=Methylobacterium phyllosphaerae TaxID=418223 RepID=UPI000A52D5A2|nr:hypothetical protein [Methylobacterium phyllosphaerae]
MRVLVIEAEGEATAIAEVMRCALSQEAAEARSPPPSEDLLNLRHDAIAAPAKAQLTKIARQLRKR